MTCLLLLQLAFPADQPQEPNPHDRPPTAGPSPGTPFVLDDEADQRDDAKLLDEIRAKIKNDEPRYLKLKSTYEVARDRRKAIEEKITTAAPEDLPTLHQQHEVAHDESMAKFCDFLEVERVFLRNSSMLDNVSKSEECRLVIVNLKEARKTLVADEAKAKKLLKSQEEKCIEVTAELEVSVIYLAVMEQDLAEFEISLKNQGGSDRSKSSREIVESFRQSVVACRSDVVAAKKEYNTAQQAVSDLAMKIIENSTQIRKNRMLRSHYIDMSKSIKHDTL